MYIYIKLFRDPSMRQLLNMKVLQVKGSVSGVLLVELHDIRTTHCRFKKVINYLLN